MNCPNTGYAPGIHRNIDLEEYFEIDAISQSGLTHLERSPAHYQAYLAQEKETEALTLGSALHTLVLQPETFAAKFSVCPNCDRRTKGGKELYEAHLDQLGGRKTIKVDAYESARQMGTAILNHPDAKELIEKATSYELTALWEYRPSGCDAPAVLCKGRADIVRDHATNGVMTDIKTTRDASLAGFVKAIANYRYHGQASWYQDGFALNGKHYPHYCIIAVENVVPYAVNVFRICEDALAEGGKRNMELVDQYARCKWSNEWPGYPLGIKDISIPQWAFKQEVEHE